MLIYAALIYIPSSSAVNSSSHTVKKARRWDVRPSVDFGISEK